MIASVVKLPEAFADLLDEPSIGLHQRDNHRLIDSLRELRDTGNSVIVVEHDEEAIRTADQVVDMGPGAGIHGGRIVAPVATAGGQQALMVIDKSRQGIQQTILEAVHFVPLKSGVA